MTTTHSMTRSTTQRISALVVCAGLLAGCAPEAAVDPIEQARAVNQNRSVSSNFPDHPVVVEDPHGFETSRALFESSETVIVVDDTVSAALRGASVAIMTHAPMLVYTPDNHRQVVEEIQRLRGHTILTVGEVLLAPARGTVQVIRDPGGMEALETMTALAYDVVEVHRPEDAVAAVVGVDEEEPVWLQATWEEPFVATRADARPFPAQGPRDADMAPKVVATQRSDLVAVINARSFGAEVSLVDNPDPVISDETLREMIGLADRPLLALGQEFGTEEQLAERTRAAEARIKAE